VPAARLIYVASAFIGLAHQPDAMYGFSLWIGFTSHTIL